MVLITGAFITACVTPHPSLLIKTDLDLTPPQTLSSDQTQKDIAYLKFALLHGYVGARYLPGDHFANAIKKLDGVAADTPQALFESIDQILVEIPDNHLVAMLNKQRSMVRLAKTKKPRVGPNSLQPAEKIWSVGMRQSKKNKKFLLIAITKFPSAKDPIWNDFIANVKTGLPQSDFVVIDFRGNTGGDDHFGLELAKLLNGGPIKYPVTNQYVRQTPETLAINSNLYRYRAITLRAEGKAVPPFFAELQKDWDDKYHLAVAGWRLRL